MLFRSRPLLGLRTLRNRAVLGEFEIDGEIVQGYFPQVIDQGDFDAARRVIKGKTKGGNRRKSGEAGNLLGGLVYDASGDEQIPMYFQRTRPGNTQLKSATTAHHSLRTTTRCAKIH